MLAKTDEEPPWDLMRGKDRSRWKVSSSKQNGRGKEGNHIGDDNWPSQRRLGMQHQCFSEWRWEGFFGRKSQVGRWERPQCHASIQKDKFRRGCNHLGDRVDSGSVAAGVRLWVTQGCSQQASQRYWDGMWEEERGCTARSFTWAAGFLDFPEAVIWKLMEKWVRRG